MRRFWFRGLAMVLFSITLFGCFKGFRSSRPASKETLKQLYEENRYEEAVKMAAALLKRNPDDEEVRLRLADIFRAQGKPREAIREYREVLRINPSNLRAKVSISHQLFTLRRYEEAIRASEEILADNPKYVPAITMLATIYTERGRYDQAIKAYEKARQIDPTAPYIYSGLGWTYYLKKDLVSSERQYKTSLKLHKTSWGYKGLGDVYRAQGKTKEAISAYREALKYQGPVWLRQEIGRQLNELQRIRPY